MSNGVRLGVAGRVRPAIVDERGAPKQDAVFVAEFDLDAAARLAIARDDSVRPLPRHPFVVRDLSIVVSDTLPAAIIRGTIQSAADGASAPLIDIAFFDRYQGKGIPPATVSLSVRLTFQAPDRTLTDKDVQETFDRILAALVKEHGATQRYRTRNWEIGKSGNWEIWRTHMWRDPIPNFPISQSPNFPIEGSRDGEDCNTIR
jgi:phenylalanyl-tRNA synthetase beta chain